jgi:hypothetical protein
MKTLSSDVMDVCDEREFGCKAFMFVAGVPLRLNLNV